MKRDGVLGQYCALRRSVLDDCRGYRFEQLLTSFSTVVLRKVNSDGQRTLSSSTRLSMKGGLADEDLALLEPLTLAFQSSLNAALVTRSSHALRVTEALKTIQDHKASFSVQIKHLQRRNDRHEKGLQDALIDPAILRKQLRHNCTGDQSWINLTLSGETTEDRDKFVENSFDDIWPRILRASTSVVTPHDKSLLDDLEQRVLEQKTRLSNWRDFQRQVSARNETLVAQRSPSKTPRRSPNKSSRKSLTKDRRTLSAAGRGGPVNAASPQRMRVDFSPSNRDSTAHVDTKGISTQLSQVIAASQNDISRGSDIQAYSPQESLKRVPIDDLSHFNSSPLALKAQEKKLKPRQGTSNLRLQSSSIETSQGDSSPVRHDTSVVLERPAFQAAQDPSHREASAGSQMINGDGYDGNVSFLSLEQRARQSMMRRSSTRTSMKRLSTSVDLKANQRTPSPVKAAIIHEECLPALNERTRETLSQSTALSRTKSHHRPQSMHKPRERHAVNPWASEDSSASSSQYLNAVNQEIEHQAVTPKQEASDHDVDYDSIFKPRHKIRHSPPGGSPAP